MMEKLIEKLLGLVWLRENRIIIKGLYYGSLKVILWIW